MYIDDSSPDETPPRSGSTEREVLQRPTIMEPVPMAQRTPTEAVIDFDGNIRRVRANHIRGGRCTRSCLGFSVHVAVLSIAALVGLSMAIVMRDDTEQFHLWLGLFTLALGAFLPSPKLKKPDVHEQELLTGHLQR